MSGLDLIYVVPCDKRKVCFSEQHSAHPGGEAWVAGNAADPDGERKPVLIARTLAASLALSRGRIKEVKVQKRVEAVPKEELTPEEIADVEARRLNRNLRAKERRAAKKAAELVTESPPGTEDRPENDAEAEPRLRLEPSDLGTSD